VIKNVATAIGKRNCKLDAASVTDVHEAELARWLFTALTPKRLLLAELGFVPGMQLAFLTDTLILAPDALGPGDIDVLAVDGKCPQQTIAIEVKRVKMPADSYLTSQPNKLQELEKGCKQVGLLREIGFHRSYLLVAVVADGREQTEVSFAFRGPTPSLVKAVKEKLRSLEFHPAVGVIVVEATQPSDKNFRDAGAIGIWSHQKASSVQQPSELTTRIASLIKSSAK
jgi:hypothetical protein